MEHEEGNMLATPARRDEEKAAKGKDRAIKDEVSMAAAHHDDKVGTAHVALTPN